MRIITFFILLQFFVFYQNLYSQNDINKKYSIDFIHPIGCKVKLKSVDKKFTNEKLELIASVLVNIPSEKKGYFNEYISVDIFPTDRRIIATESKYVSFINKRLAQIKRDTKKLKGLDIPKEFKSLKKAHIQNREQKLFFCESLSEWIMNGDNNSICRNLDLIFLKQRKADSLLDKILMSKISSNEFYNLNSKLYNLYHNINRKKLNYIDSLEFTVLSRNNVVWETETNCDD